MRTARVVVFVYLGVLVAMLLVAWVLGLPRR
jgi:hypothetical protein